MSRHESLLIAFVSAFDLELNLVVFMKKLSQYNVHAENGEYTVVFNTYRNVYVCLRTNVYKKLSDSHFLESLPQKNKVLYEKLSANGIILDQEIDEYQLLVEEHKKEIEESLSYDLTLLPTLDCNLRCWYCFERHIKGSHLTEEARNRIISHVNEIIKDNSGIKLLNLCMFGGEPLLYFETEVYPLLLQIRNLVHSKMKEVVFSFITNGILITEQNISLFADLKANFQISIDGCKRNHDKIKFIPHSNNSTYEEVMHVIHLITANPQRMVVNLRINYNDDTLVDLPNIINDLKDIDRGRIRIHLERVWQTSPKASSRVLLKDAINKFMLNGFYVTYMNLFRRSFSCWSSKRRHSVVSYDGAVYNCTGRDFTDATKEGELLNDGTVQCVGQVINMIKECPS